MKESFSYNMITLVLLILLNIALGLALKDADIFIKLWIAIPLVPLEAFTIFRVLKSKGE